MTVRRITSFVLTLILMSSALGFAAGAANAVPAHRDPGGTSKEASGAAGEPGVLSGTVTTADGGSLDGEVDLYQWEPDGEYFDNVDFRSVGGDSTGSAPYSFTEPAGTYYVVFFDYSGQYVTSYGSGATAPPSSTTDPGAVTLTDGGAVTSDVSVLPQPGRVAVTGHVQDTAGTPVAGVEVYTRQDDTATDSGDTVTDSDGDYRLNLRAGTYDLVASDGGDQFENGTTSVVVDSAPVTASTITLARIGRFTVSGSVGDGAALAGVDVTLYRVVDYGGGDVETSYVDDTSTTADGTYAFSGVRASATYTVRADTPGHITTWLGDVPTSATATTFTVSGDTTLPAVTMPRSSSVRGTVSGPSGAARNVDVQLLRYNESDTTFESYDDTFTEDDGTYSFPTVPPGSYTLYFSPGLSSPLQDAYVEGSTLPDSTTSPGVFQVTTTPAAVVLDKTLAKAQTANGSLVNGSGTPISGASIVAFAYSTDDQTWAQVATALSDDNGAYSVRVPSSTTVTFRFARGGYQPQFLGGGSTLPVTPSATDSRVTDATGDLALDPVTLAPFQSTLGTVAGQRLDYCLANSLPSNDDGSSDAVDIPFDLTFFGTPYTQLYVNNNGNITFGSPQGTYTPSDITGDTGRPIIAPFFADVDTEADGSNVVTYGTSPDGKTLCVNWADVGYFGAHDDLLNTFQLLLTQNSTDSGRVAGDFDITFDYDRLQWETGDASGGRGGLGGTSALAGFSAGTGQPGTFVQLPGSLENGALIDGGPKALVSSSQGSSQTGRYVFPVRNDGLTSALGSLHGTVVRDAGGAPVGGAYVQVCTDSGTSCSYANTTDGGDYSFAGIPAGSYRVQVWPNDDSLFAGGTSVSVGGGQAAEAPPVRLGAPVPVPPNVTLASNSVNAAGVPSVYYGDPIPFRLTGCPGVTNPTYSVTLADGEVLRDRVAMPESPSGTYSVTIAPFYPAHGDARISTNIPATCGGANTSFDVYIDPSGVVTDQYGRPLAGVTATLSRSDTAGGTYSAVPDGSNIMSPSNRHNPSTTSTLGAFAWDVQSGYYEVQASRPGCTTASSDELQVPPAQIDLLIKLDCTDAAPTPEVAPSVSGAPKVGQTVTAHAASWTAPIVSSGVQLLRDGTPLPSLSYTLLPSDVGATFTAVDRSRRPDYVTQSGTGATVSFTPATATSAGVTGLVGDAPTTTAQAAPTGTGKVGTVLTAIAPTWSLDGVATTQQWLRDGTAIAGATGLGYAVTPADVGHRLTVAFSGAKTGYTTGVVTTAAVTGALGDPPTAPAAPTPTGTGKVGTVLTATPPTWSLDGVTTTQQWLRDGTVIDGAVALTYTVTAADAGHLLTVAYAGVKPGYANGSTSSAALTGALGDAATASAVPTISGRAAVGQVLTAGTGTWSADGLAYAYQWLRAGASIAGATGSTYRVTSTDVARALSVRVTASRAGYQDGIATSAATTVAKVATSTAVRLAKAKIRAKQAPQVTVTVSSPGLVGPTGAILVRDGRTVIARTTLRAAGHGVVRLTLKKLRKGRHTITAVYAGSTTTTGSTSRPARLTVTK